MNSAIVKRECELGKRFFGAHNLPAPAIGLGCNALGHIASDEAGLMIAQALDRGITVFDTANVYADGRSEIELGRLLPNQDDRIIVATKFGHPGGSLPGTPPCAPLAVNAAVDASLRRLRRDRLDLCLIHFPDEQTPIDATLQALAALIGQGKIRDWGLSNFSSDQTEVVLLTAMQIGMPPPAVIQGEYSLLRQHASLPLIDLAQRHRIAFMPFFPLASGLLTGKYRQGGQHSTLRARIVRQFEERFLTADTMRKIEAFGQLCDEAGVAMASVALQWLVRKPQISTILTGASSAAQLVENCKAIDQPIPDQIFIMAQSLMADILTCQER